MKKTLITLLISFAIFIAQAQSGHSHWNHINSGYPNPNIPTTSTIILNAEHGEAFVVYIDGDIVNQLPQSHVMIPNVTHELHDVYVVLKRPTDKIVMMSFFPQHQKEEIAVAYDMQQRILSMTCLTSVIPINERWETCSSEDFDRMLIRLKKESFDDDRMDLAKMFLSGPVYFTSQQIKEMAEVFSFSKGKVEFLKASYENCSDPHNFYICIDVLPFSSDKKEVMNYIR